MPVSMLRSGAGSPHHSQELPGRKHGGQRKRALIVNCYFDGSGCFIESNECTDKKDNAQERTLHVTTPWIWLTNHRAGLYGLLGL